MNALSDALPIAQYEIVADEPQFLLVSKSPDVSIHCETNSADCTADNRSVGVIEQLRKDFAREDFLPVHRLDKATSGLLLVGKGSDNTRVLSKLFQDKLITKFYWAVAKGKPIKKQGKIVGDMEKTRGGSYKLSKSSKNPSVTQFQSYSLSPGLRAYLLKPLTGKTHQLRVVMKSLGVPILGDQRYGKSNTSINENTAYSNRLYLHAAGLSFDAFGKQYCFEDAPTFVKDFDPGFERLLQELGSVFRVHFPAYKIPSKSAS